MASIRHLPFRNKKNPNYLSAHDSHGTEDSREQQALSPRPIVTRDGTFSNLNSSEPQRSALNQLAITPSATTDGSHGTNSSEPLSESVAHAGKQKGRKRGAIVQLKVPLRGCKVLLEPAGDRQFTYKNFQSKDSTEYKYNTQFGIILKREYPGIIEEKDGDTVISSRLALNWEDYHDVNTMNDIGQSAADRVKQEFWNLFEVHVVDINNDEEVEKAERDADQILENYGTKKVKDMMYQLRLDAVKLYYESQGEILDDTLACQKQLTYDEYLASRVAWCSAYAWPEICQYWVSKKYELKRKRGQDCRLKSKEVAQNRGGSLPFAVAQQHMGEKFGAQNATVLNTYAAMKSGIKNLDENCIVCPKTQYLDENCIVCKPKTQITRKAQKRIDDYCATAETLNPENWDKAVLDGKVLYQSSRGIPHGRLAIADGAIKKCDVMDAARAMRVVRAANSVPRREHQRLQRVLEEHERVLAEHQRVLAENEQLKLSNQTLAQKSEMHDQLILGIYKEINKDPPAELLQIGSNVQPYGTTPNSHVVSQGAISNNCGEELAGEIADNGSGNMAAGAGTIDSNIAVGAAGRIGSNNSNIGETMVSKSIS